jgi:hypothetical protein
MVGVVEGRIESVIHFVDGDQLEVEDTVEEIETAIGDLRTGRVPLIRVHVAGGRESRINADQIKRVHGREPSE